MTVAAAFGFYAFGVMSGIWYAERMWWLLSGPGPWRLLARLYRRTWREMRLCWTTGRWT